MHGHAYRGILCPSLCCYEVSALALIQANHEDLDYHKS